MTLDDWKLTDGNQGVNMNENAKKWIKALKSKEFEQCTGQLKKDNGYCCLGVAGSMFLKEKNKKGFDSGRYGKIDDLSIDDLTYLPPEVMDWLNLQTSSGDYTHKRHQSLALDNDQGKTFSQIANIIESEPEGLFKE